MQTLRCQVHSTLRAASDDTWRTRTEVCSERADAKAQQAGHLLVPKASGCAVLHSRVAKVLSIRLF